MRPLLVLAVLTGCGEDPAGGAPDAPATGDAATSCGDATPWAPAPPLARGATQETAVVAVGTRLYILGGFDGDAQIVDAVQIFDTETCSYTMGPALPKAVHHINAGVIDGTIYVAGSLEGLAFTAIGDTWSWNPATETTWTPRASMPAGTQRGAGVTGVIGGKLYIAGGLRGGAVTDVSSYDPATDQWTPEAALPQARDHACGAAVGGKLYVIGGRQASIGSTTGTVFELAPGGGWATKTAMPTARGGTACGVVGERIVVVGGEGNPDAATGVFAEAEAYDAAADQWQSLAPMPTPRHGMGAAGIGTKLYVPGGADKQAFAAVATHEILTP